MKKGFSLVELMIVVAVLGILAAMVVPQFQSQTTQAKGATAKTNLRVLRGAIKFYAAQHKGIPPGYPNGDVTAAPSEQIFICQLMMASNKSGQTATPGTAGFNLGPYIKTFPKNPFNKVGLVKMVGNSEEFPAAATGDFGYIYQPATLTIRLDWRGADKSGINYYDY